MSKAINSASLFARPTTELNANAMRFLDEKWLPCRLDIPDCRKLSRFFPVIVLVPKSAVEDEAQKKPSPNESVTELGIALKKANAEDSKDGKWSSRVYGEWPNGLRKHSRVGKTVSVGSESSHDLGLKRPNSCEIRMASTFLERCEAGGITLKNCPAYIRERIMSQKSTLAKPVRVRRNNSNKPKD